MHVHPPPPPPAKIVPLRNVQKRRERSAQIYRQKKNAHVPLGCDKIKTKKVEQKRKKVLKERDKVKEIKNKDSHLSEIEIVQ